MILVLEGVKERTANSVVNIKSSSSSGKLTWGSSMVTFNHSPAQGSSRKNALSGSEDTMRKENNVISYLHRLQPNKANGQTILQPPEISLDWL